MCLVYVETTFQNTFICPWRRFKNVTLRLSAYVYVHVITSSEKKNYPYSYVPYTSLVMKAWPKNGQFAAATKRRSLFFKCSCFILSAVRRHVQHAQCTHVEAHTAASMQHCPTQKFVPYN